MTNWNTACTECPDSYQANFATSLTAGQLHQVALKNKFYHTTVHMLGELHRHILFCIVTRVKTLVLLIRSDVYALTELLS